VKFSSIRDDIEEVDSPSGIYLDTYKCQKLVLYIPVKDDKIDSVQMKLIHKEIGALSTILKFVHEREIN